MLAVENQGVRFGARRRGGALYRAPLETDVTAGLQQHEGADRVSTRDRGEQTDDVVIRPHPAALKLRQLCFTLGYPPQQFDQLNFVDAECLFRHDPPPPRH